jgi:hypothetical protein
MYALEKGHTHKLIVRKLYRRYANDCINEKIRVSSVVLGLVKTSG